jgi:hypothetical protein
LISRDTATICFPSWWSPAQVSSLKPISISFIYYTYNPSIYTTASALM